MFFNLAALLDDVDRWMDHRGWEDKTLYMAIVESMLVHRRNLMDFYFPAAGYDTEKRRESDIFATDFCHVWAPIRPALFKDEWNAISEEILHLTHFASGGREQLAIRTDARRTPQAHEAVHRCRRRETSPQHQSPAPRDRLQGAAMERVVTPKVESELAAVSPQMLSGLTPGLSTPTSGVLRSD